MKKIVGLTRSERGQSIVIVALVFVGLVALAGLAIDGGNLFVQRRQAQNAADASALAGTRLIAQVIQTCDPIDMPAFDAEVDRTINRYAEQNGVRDTNGVAGDEVNDNVIAHYVDKDGTPLGQVGETGALPLGAAGVRAEIKDRDATFFLSVVGIQEIPSSAPAMALTGVVKQLPGGGPLLPIAVPKIAVEGFEGGEEWAMHDNLDGEFCDAAGENCIEDPDAPYNAQRGWLNLNHNFNALYLGSSDELNRTFEQSISTAGCPKDPSYPPASKSDLPGLPGYASGECPYALPIFAGSEGGADGDFIHGTVGARSTGVRAVYEAFETMCNSTVESGWCFAPVFDQVYLREEMVDAFGAGAASPYGFPNGGGFATAGGGGASYYYHVVGYVAIQGDPAKKNNHVVYGEFQYKVVSGGIEVTGYTGSGICTPMLMGMALWE